MWKGAALRVSTPVQGSPHPFFSTVGAGVGAGVGSLVGAGVGSLVGAGVGCGLCVDQSVSR